MPLHSSATHHHITDESPPPPAFGSKNWCVVAEPFWNQQRWHVLPGAEREISQVGCQHSPHYNSVIYAKLCLYGGSINGWGRCYCLKQGISLSLMSRDSVMGLFTLLWWQGAGVIRNTNPLINFWNGGSFWSGGGFQRALPGTMLVSSAVSLNLHH